MMLRTNKPMPESSGIYEKVFRAARSMRPTTLLIPWSDFVFSTRDGKTFMPPTLAKGIELVSGSPRPYASRDGVVLTIAPAFTGAYAGDLFLIKTPEVASETYERAIRHEVLHFVQSVGDNLVRLTKGDPTAFTEFGLLRRLGGDPNVKPTEKVLRAHIRGIGSGLYGGPKRRSATMGRGVPLGKHTPAHHALLDVEFQTDSLDVANKYLRAYGKGGGSPERLAEQMREDSTYLTFTELMPPRRKKDFTRAAFQRTAEMVGVSAELTPSVRLALGELVAAPLRPEDAEARRMLRTNKPMPESPRIVAKVTRAIKQGGGDLVIPWSDFVFSTRNGQVYLPPTLAKGIEMVSRDPRPLAGPNGVVLLIRVDEDGGARYEFGVNTLYAPDIDEHIRHEVLHFVQHIGDSLIRIGRGDARAFTPHGLIEHAMERFPFSPHLSSLEEWNREQLNILGESSSLLYGGPKRRSAKSHRYLPTPEAVRVEKKHHALLDVEFQTDALTVAHTAVDSLGRRAARGPALDAAIERAAAEYVGALPPIRLKDFMRTVRQRAHALLDERAQRRATPEPLPVSAGLRIVQESVGGRMAYVIYRGAASTGKYGFSEAKAREIMGRMKA